MNATGNTPTGKTMRASRLEAPQPLLECVTPEGLRVRNMAFDVLRMRVPGGWLITTIVVLRVAREQDGVSQSTVFVADPEGTWSPRLSASDEDGQS